MSFREGKLGGEERECEESVLGSTESKSVRENGSLTATQLTIDENLLVDPKLLFIGSKIGEGAHGKVYEGRSVAKPWMCLSCFVICMPCLNFVMFSLKIV